MYVGLIAFAEMTDYARPALLCSIVETGRRNGRRALAAIRLALAAPVAGPAAA